MAIEKLKINKAQK